MLTEVEMIRARGTKLSDNFTLYELIRSANHPNLVAYPSDEIVEKLTNLAVNTLQKIRNEVGRLSINSGYRNPALNSEVGGVSNSVHQYIRNEKYLGQAADIVPHTWSLVDTMNWIIDNCNELQLKTAIIYPSRGFIHVDTREDRATFEAMVSKSKGSYEYYTRG